MSSKLLSLKEVFKIFLDNNPQLKKIYPGIKIERLILEYERFFGKKISQIIDQENLSQFNEKILQGIPLEQITNESFFYKNSFYVNSHVLIPRSETEILVENVVDWINNSKNRGCLLYTSPSPRDATLSRMPSSA